MSIKNDTDSKRANEQNRYTQSFSDTNEHDFPDTDGDDATSAGSGYNVGSAAHVNARIVNNQDQDLTARLEATGHTDRDSFSEANKLVESVTVSSGGGVEALYWSLENDGSYSQLRVVVSFSSSPSGNNDTVVEFRKSQE